MLTNSKSIALSIIQLITSPDQDAPQLVQSMKQQNLIRDIIELIESVIVNKFTNLNRLTLLNSQECLKWLDILTIQFRRDGDKVARA
jgi:predicted transposase YdaD